MNGWEGALTSLLVKIFTTEGIATSAAVWNPPALSACSTFALVASRMVASFPRGVHGSNSGRKVETTKNGKEDSYSLCKNQPESLHGKSCIPNKQKGIMHQNMLENYLNDLLGIQQFRDYCPNGLQVEGRTSIQTLVSGVTASQALIQAAVGLRADAIIVHHGYFWRGKMPVCAA